MPVKNQTQQKHPITTVKQGGDGLASNRLLDVDGSDTVLRC